MVNTKIPAIYTLRGGADTHLVNTNIIVAKYI